MNRFFLTIEASVDVPGGAIPTLEVLIGGVVVSSGAITAQTGVGFNLLNFELDYTGLAPSSLQFRLAGGDGGEIVSLETVRINGTKVNTANDLTAEMISVGSPSDTTIANVDHLFGRVEPTSADIDDADYDGTFNGDGGDNHLRTGGDDDKIDGGDGDDRIVAQAGDDAIIGGNGNDVLFGGDGNDVIIGESGSDVLFGNAGDDLLFSGADDDFILGGDGNDVINGGAGNDMMAGDGGNDIIYGEGGDDTLIGDAGDDSLYGDAGNDTAVGGAGADTIFGGANDDMISGGDDDDILNGEDGVDTVTGDAGNDTVNGGAGDDMVAGGTGDDTVNGGADDDFVYGEDGIDILNGDGGNDFLFGGRGADTLNGGDGNDVLRGHSMSTFDPYAILAANPNVVYNATTDSFYEISGGTANYSTSFSNAAANTLMGINGHLVTINTAVENTFVQSLLGAGQSTWMGASDAAVADEWIWTAGPEAGTQFWQGLGGGSAVNGQYENWSPGEPNDDAGPSVFARMQTNGTWTDRADSFSYNYVTEWEGSLFFEDNAADTLNGGNGNDILYGHGGDDILNGDAGIDHIYAGSGNDTADGGDGVDIIFGNDGNDILYGGAGDDTIDGGDGDDTIYGSIDWFDNDWSHRQEITIDSGQISGNLTDHTILITEDGFGADFWSNVKADGSDIVVTLSDGVTKLNIELAAIDTGAETMQLYVNVPSISATVDTDLFIFYGNAAASETNDTTTWRSEYSGVWHFEDDLGSGTQLSDSSQSASHGQARQGLTVADVINAPTDNGLQFNNNEYIAVDKAFNSAGELPGISASAWINTTSSGGGYNANWSILDFDRSEFFNVYIDGGTGQLAFSTNVGSTIHDMSAGPAVNDGAWHHVVAVYDGADKILYVDGAEVARVVNAHGGAALGENITRYGFIGDGSEANTFDGGRNNLYYDGQLDEVRLYEGVLSADQIAAEYNNHSSPNTFYSVDPTAETITTGDDVDTLNGGDGNDTLYASNGGDTLNGGDGNDTLYGSVDGDTLRGDAGNDTIYADASSQSNASSSLSDIILADNPDGYWQLNETAGATADNQGAGGSSIDGTYQNGAVLNQNTLFVGGGPSVQFDGTNDYISLPDSALINTAAVNVRTVELVFNADTTAGRQVLFEEGGGTNAMTIYIDAGQIYFNAVDNSSGPYGPFNISTAINAGQTYHAAFVLDSPNNTFSGYLDGALVGSGVTNGTMNAHTGDIGIGAQNQANYYHDGADNTNLTHFFQGRISDVALYNAALTQADLQERSDFVQGVLSGPAPAIDDTLYGGDGLDTLYGGEGRDSFVFESATAFNNVDQINNYDYFEFDALDISDLLTGFTAGSSDINEWVQITQSGSDSIVAVDANGLAGGSNYINIAQINDVAGLDAATMETNGHLIV